ncbi:MAG: hypothetical protein HKN53_08770 [Maribacter sp.]|nr:hypothetical protein [Maribacter sp.]
MKSVTKKLQVVLVAVMLLSASGIMANNSYEKNTIHINTADDLVGAWNYTVEEVDYQYRTGVLLITKEAGKYNVQVQLSAGNLTGEEVDVKGNKIFFSVNIEGQKISVSLEAQGDKLKGESSSYDGTYKIEGTKIMPE